RGVGPESIVGIRADRSLELVTGVLGILKTGAAYLPLDPHYPHERVSFMLQDSGASALLTQDEIATEMCDEEAETPFINTDPNSLAYVIYTSGSTGRPKGVAVSHAALLNLVAWHVSTFKVSASDRST